MQLAYNRYFEFKIILKFIIYFKNYYIYTYSCILFYLRKNNKIQCTSFLEIYRYMTELMKYEILELPKLDEI